MRCTFLGDVPSLRCNALWDRSTPDTLSTLLDPPVTGGPTRIVSAYSFPAALFFRCCQQYPSPRTTRWHGLPLLVRNPQILVSVCSTGFVTSAFEFDWDG